MARIFAVPIDLLGVVLSTYTLSATTAPANVLSVSAASFRTVKVILQAVRGTDFQSSEILIHHDGTNANSVEYGLIHSTSAAFVTYTVDISAGQLRLRASTDTGTASITAFATQLPT